MIWFVMIQPQQRPNGAATVTPQDISEQLVSELGPADQAYLQQLGAARMCVDPDWAPYEVINSNGEHEGIAADLLKVISARAGVTLELYPTRDWKESIAASKEGKCQLLSFLNQTPERDKWLIFTDPYFTDPNVFITREEHAFISNPASLRGETVVLPEGTSVEERLRRDYPNLEIVTVPSEVEAIRMVSERKANMTVRSLTMAAYTIKEEGLFNLKIAGQLANYYNYFRIGVAKDQPVLRGLLNRGVNSLTPQEVDQIVNRYIAIEAQTVVDYSAVAGVIIFFSLLALAGLVWNYQLRSLNASLEARQEELLALSKQLSADIAARKQAEETLAQRKLEMEHTNALLEDALRRANDMAVQAVLAEDMVRERENDLNEAQHLAHIGSWKYMPAKEEMFWSQEMFRIFGRDPALGVPDWPAMRAQIHPDDWAAFDSALSGALADGKPCELEFRALHLDGHLLWLCLTVGKAAVNHSGEIEWISGTIQDVTERKRLQEELQQQAATDALTGVANRRHFFELAQREIKRAARHKRSMAVAFLDLDHFKDINDTYGHAAGDRALMSFIQICRSCIREVDVVGRLGGDEFALLLPEASVQQAFTIVERIRAALALNPVVADDQRSFTLTMSSGIAGLRADGETLDELLARADSVLYEAKGAGRNQVVVAQN